MTSEDVQNPGRYPLVAIRDTTIKPMVVRVGNISFDTTATIIWNLLSTAGKISWITVNVLKDNPNEKAGLVNFENEEDAKRAVSILHLYTVNGEQQWTVEHVDETTCWDEFVETEYVFETTASSACLNTTE
jgi:RNA recognition motif-containing protein